eukprot:7340317-Prymnesium_polylepis.1
MCRAREQRASRASHNSVRPPKLATRHKACRVPYPYPPTTIQFRKKGVIGTEPSLECVTPGMGRNPTATPQPKKKQEARQAAQY